ncbi:MULTISPECIES: MBL fold metallo-hydrolase [Streptomyces]|uniref:MBL fold metallo-hydrolase n=1 Tax=Streptomyces TaxID=1883 RepID=UPI000564F1A9|nr:MULTISPECIES: MBL fold metallo-hydrolase [Streptomyces]AKL69175.1 beta-lactamase [Streptomyces sp. Mg1]PJN19868.1 MBL fold metallo-hydrolase [Streptomyces sp. CB02120-2]RPK33183.1 putative quorum-quenching lactonase YtnP [Streptomyces sp. ADI91-18]WBY23494.1 MBL fold metallo-hydrolase [Streptomyces goshikiensis]WSX96387.1 MBL fold metallo-hydrolase [Streptomyces goshikiensis]
MKNENEQSIVLGDVEVLRVVEWQGPLVPAADFVPEAGAELWKANEEWLAPDHWEPERDLAVVALQTWVLRSAGRTILVDTGVGNGRERPGSPRFHHWQADFLGELERAGVRPEDVDLVVNTHVHADHVGGNTVDEAGEWVPAFPNAEYLIPAADDHWFGPRGGYGKGLREDDRLLYEDSVAPVHRAGQAVLWEGAHRIDEHLTLESAPGHTPGSAVLRLDSGGDRAVFVGDLLHSPVQILRPSCNSCFCMDEAEAAASRLRILERAADTRELVVPAHFGGAGAVEVRRDGAGFALGPWGGHRPV